MPVDPLDVDFWEQRLRSGVPLSHAEQEQLAEYVGRGPAQDIATRLDAQAKKGRKRPKRETWGPVGPDPLPGLIGKAIQRIRSGQLVRPTDLTAATGWGFRLGKAGARAVTRGASGRRLTNTSNTQSRKTSGRATRRGRGI